VEVDSTVNDACLDTALSLKSSFRDVCDIQIAGSCTSNHSMLEDWVWQLFEVFAQDPLFNDDGSKNSNYCAYKAAFDKPGISVIGSAPYVERKPELAQANIACVLELAQEHGLLVDFHLDYNLNPSETPLIYDVIHQLPTHQLQPPPDFEMTVAIGHATRLSMLSRNEWAELKTSMATLPIHFIGLPQSDLYMMGRNSADSVLAPRGTLNILRLKNEHDIPAAMSINNVQNAFTPQGSVDPLSLCPLGVAIFQSATARDCRTLLVGKRFPINAVFWACPIGVSDCYCEARNGRDGDVIELGPTGWRPSRLRHPSRLLVRQWSRPEPSFWPHHN
jgi:hypothetical protein